MKKNRPVILMVVLLGLLLFYFYENYSNENISQHKENLPVILTGVNEIYQADIFKDDAGVVTVRVDYYFTGAPNGAALSAELYLPQLASKKVYYQSEVAKVGKNSVLLKVQNPRFFDDRITANHEVTVYMRKKNDEVLAEKKVPFDIDWDSPKEALWKQKIAHTSLDDLYKESVSLIDKGSRESIDTAEMYLNRVILKDSNFAPAYLELARIAMTNSWNEEGLFRAEQNILSSLKIDNNNPNAKVLLGYVYAHQRKYKEAEANFIEAEKIGTNNLWLWANWGELFWMQDKQKEAIDKYMKAVDGPRPFNTYDRARLDSYKKLFILLKVETSKSQLDALYKKRAEEFSGSPCYNVDYGKFRLMAYDDYQTATNYVQKAIDSGCNDQKAKNTLGLSYYYSWLNTESIGDIAKARAFYPEGAALFYELTQSSQGVKVLKKLVSGGTSIDVRDREGRTALALALFEQDSVNAKKIIQFGASVNIVLGEEQFPISFIPLMYGDEKSIALMNANGIDYHKVKFNGMDGIAFSQYYRNSQAVTNGKKI